MTISAYEVVIRNDDRGTGSTKFFSVKNDAQRFFNNYKMIPGDTVKLIHIEDKALVEEK